jgi:hypothetical protein
MRRVVRLLRPNPIAHCRAIPWHAHPVACTHPYGPHGPRSYSADRALSAYQKSARVTCASVVLAVSNDFARPSGPERTYCDLHGPITRPHSRTMRQINEKT